MAESLRCVECGAAVAASREGDYICPTHRFVDAWRESDGAVLDGRGRGANIVKRIQHTLNWQLQV